MSSFMPSKNIPFPAASIATASGAALRIVPWSSSAAARRREFAEKMHLTLLGARLAPGSRILDFGCGPDAMASKFFSGRGHETFSIDTCEVVVRRAKDLAPRATFLIGDVNELDFPEDYFDLILSQKSLAALPREGCAHALRHLARLMRPAALLAIGVDYHDAAQPSRLDEMVAAGRSAGLSLIDVLESHYWFAKT